MKKGKRRKFFSRRGLKNTLPVVRPTEKKKILRLKCIAIYFSAKPSLKFTKGENPFSRAKIKAWPGMACENRPDFFY